MRKAIHTKQLTISLTDDDYERVKQITNEKEISMADWFRAAAKLKFKKEEQGDIKDDR